MSEKITKPCRVGGVTFQIGVSVDTVIKASQRLYERQLNNPENPQVEMKDLRKLITGTHVLLPRKLTNEVIKEAEGWHSCIEIASDNEINDIYEGIIEAVEKEDAQQDS